MSTKLCLINANLQRITGINAAEMRRKFGIAPRYLWLSQNGKFVAVMHLHEEFDRVHCRYGKYAVT
jgi:hypothetical protein